MAPGRRIPSGSSGHDMGKLGDVITFYSYKGGVGRSMALANVAWSLANRGSRVLTIDFDLEAPGLPRYFAPFLDQRALVSSPGLIDFFFEHVERAKASRGFPSISLGGSEGAQEALMTYAVPVKWSFPDGGTIDLLPSGKPGPAYARRVSGFDWHAFYEFFAGRELLQRIRKELQSQYDYVLVDSRTGLNDTAGICTVLLPDAVVVCF